MKGFGEEATEGAYPRTRGRNGSAKIDLLIATGLSPYIRGNRGDHCLPPSHPGSIPAHAGERGRDLEGEKDEGPIPAHAGGPSPAIPRSMCCWVYPHPRGGTHAATRSQLSERGLSPPTRGNHIRMTSLSSVKGLSPPTRGNHDLARLFNLASGLSPPTRGNPHNQHIDFPTMSKSKRRAASRLFPYQAKTFARLSSSGQLTIISEIRSPPTTSTAPLRRPQE